VAKSLSAAKLGAPGASGPTEAGVLLGTPAYMSPEQARGLIIDKRADIWAFGCLLYELLTGRQAFAGSTASDSLVAVLEREPDMAIVPAGTPAAVRSLLRHCLAKDPQRRLRDIADARLAIDDALNPPPGERSGLAAPDVRSKRAAVGGRVVWLLAGLAIAAAAGMVARELLPGASSADRPRRTITSVVLPRGMRLGGADLQAQASESRFAISPDGRQLALIASDESGRVRLWLRDLGSAAFQPLPQTEDASFPFWSPDSGFDRVCRCGTAQSHPPVRQHTDDGERRRLPDWSVEPGQSHPVRAGALLTTLCGAGVRRGADTGHVDRHVERRGAARRPRLSAGWATLLVLQHRQS
jgi:hypothetical protein